MAISFIYFDVLEIQGNFTIAAFIHFFTPGKLRIQSEVHFVSVNVLAELINQTFKEDILESTRRWLQRGESPYPGYCRAPGSNNCLPLFCNCQKLREAWNKAMQTKETLTNKQSNKTDPQKL